MASPVHAVPQQTTLQSSLQSSLQQSSASPFPVLPTQPPGNTNTVTFPQVHSAQGMAQSSGSNVPLSAEELRVKLISEEKYLEDRIGHVERHFSALARDLGGVVRKTAHLRNKGDNIVKTLKDFGNNENGEVKTSLLAVAECFSALEDCSDVKIDKMESRVVKPLLDYGPTCRKARDEVRMIHNVGEKEVYKRKTVERTKLSYPTNRKKIAQSESDLQKAKVDRMRTAKTVEDYMMEFERRRTADLKLILLEYIHAQLVYHSRAMELFTAAYQKTLDINEQEVAEKYLVNLAPRKIHMPTTHGRSDSITTGGHLMSSASPLSANTPLNQTPAGSTPNTPSHTMQYPTPTVTSHTP